MHKRLWNSLKLTFTLRPVSPILIKSGGISLNPALPDMQFVRTFTANGESVFIPGSSLKGVFRSFSEKVLRTADPQFACEPFPNLESYCGRKLERVDAKSENNTKENVAAQIYRQSCRACKIYGNTRLRGRLSFTDMYPNGPTKTETRYGVAISRLSHAVAVGPFDMEVLVAGQFQGALVLENFEVWHLGLLALTLQAINDGIVKIGFGKNRGLGQVAMQVQQATFALAKKTGIPQSELWGVGMFLDDQNRREYGVSASDKLMNVPQPTQVHDVAVLLQRTYQAQQWSEIEKASIASLNQLLEGKA
ncbi:MAG: RAMP superfamily CRISPR-associated protein [Gemmatales bacterium]|nr:RAMP superfamily CRISPR-associated protein [Gemmatales bacterium]MCS7159751.1 RAMP superfamily CRISPR-associated protein [Gemmatales bacterium]MDW8174949.1 RAMP superfamily CRISPR-associated protein [Gemmatales bacterium]MDW8221331.1 RAMP superfamily CRISPR-associated protein [Gemmatales bacterium]